MKVEWLERTAPDCQTGFHVASNTAHISDKVPSDEFERREGEVIDIINGFFSGTRFVVKTTDGDIEKVPVEDTHATD